ncbi:uncharacterized protein LOC131958215 isoform X2 [Physella acuta]|uniref:uncharacterized protein LOC131958215 isoform X2 n=1 Tax=Physella acuta TaxID=109671 RepID=UPI0027DE1ED4|nr:uncharacterized protein LOC131958215 isoform X2 [Physella acuta]
MTAKNKKKDGGGDAKARNGGKNGKVNGKEQGKLLKDEKKQIRQRRDSEDSQVSFESVEDYIPTPPDGGWGWVIVCSSVFCNLIVDGIGYSFGVFLQEFVEYFKEPKSKVSLVGSLLCGTYLFAGPIVSGMTNKFGCRPVIIAGSLIATVAFILACFSTSLVMLIITYGVIGGFGLGMIYLPAIVSVGYYFEKKRAFATGIAVAGSGLGTFIFPPLSEFLINELTWQGGLLIIAGIILNGCLCGALMRPLKPQKPKPRDKPRSKTLLDRIKENTHRESAAITIAPDPSNQKLSVSSAGDSAVTSSPARDVASSPGSQVTPRVQSPSSGQESEKEDYRDGKISPDPESEAKISEVAESVATGASDYFTPPVSPSTTTPNSPVHEASSSGSSPVKSVQEDPKEELQKKSTHRQQSNGAVPASDFAPLLEVPAPVFKPSGSKTGSYGGSRTSMLHIHSINSLHVSKKDLSRPMYRKDIFYSGSVLNIPEYKSQTDIRSFITSITTIPGEMEFVDGPSPSSRCINSLCSFLPRSVRDILSEMVDISLFKDISFMLICLGNITAFLGFYIPFMFLVDRAVLLDVDKSNAAFLISIIGITNTVGRVIVGKLADLHIIDSLIITYVSIALCGLVVAVVPFCNTYPLLATNAAIFGLGMAAFISLSSIVICDRMGLEKLTNAFGLMSMVRGIAGMAGPPLAGFLYDATGDYDLSFYIGGLLLFVGAACHCLLHLPCLKQDPKVTNTTVEAPPDEILELIGSKPQIITVDEALSAV